MVNPTDRYKIKICRQDFSTPRPEERTKVEGRGRREGGREDQVRGGSLRPAMPESPRSPRREAGWEQPWSEHSPSAARRQCCCSVRPEQPHLSGLGRPWDSGNWDWDVDQSTLNGIILVKTLLRIVLFSLFLRIRGKHILPTFF